MKENIVAVIPARGGSKRIKDKNIKLFKGEPAISNTIKKLKKSKIFSRIIVSTFCFFKKKINMIFKKYYKKRSQDLKQIFCDAGQFYWGSKNSWLKEKMHFSKKSDVAEISKWRYHDIDTLDDWEKAEKIIDAGFK